MLKPLDEFALNLGFHFSETLNMPLVKPYWIYISLSHRCTLRCQMCGVVKILNGYELPTEDVQKALNEISQRKSDCVVMFTGGEPFLRDDIFELINYGVKRNLKTEAVSNGSLIDEELAHKIITSGLGNIAISLDGVNESTHDFIREKGSFKKATSAIEELTKIKKKLGSGPQISVWTTIMKENLGELFDVISLVKNLGVDCLVYHPVVVTQEDMQNTSPNAPFWIREDGLRRLREQIDKIVDYKDKYGLVAFLHDPYLWLEYFSGTLNKKDWKCNPFVFINIGPDAEVRSCGSTFGNIKEMSLSECLNTEEAFKARKFMKVCQKPCLQTCWAHPESDSLLRITESFVNKIKDGQNKEGILKEALKILERYENQLIDHKCLS